MRAAALPLLFVGALLASGCEIKQPTTLADTAALYPIAVEPRIVYLKLTPAADGALRWADASEVRAFLADWNAGGHGPLKASAPTRAAQPRLSAGVRQAAYDIGANGARVQAGPPTEDPTALLLAFEKLVAVPPVCDMEAASLSGEKNDRSAVLGCATRRNLAAMVADPGDLVAPATSAYAPLAGRRALVIENWRKGKPTAAQDANSDEGGVAFISRVLGSGK
jgi:pilus assembly protein CpaD